jgi:hypothetical protein
MENLAENESYAVAKQEARALYAKIRQVWCPVLSANIIFNKAGFKHLFHKHRKFRTKNEQRRRIALLPYAKEILGTYQAEVIYQKRSVSLGIKINGKKIKVDATTHFWALTKTQDNKTIRIIVRQFEGQEKHFFSIFEVNKKSTPER